MWHVLAAFFRKIAAYGAVYRYNLYGKYKPYQLFFVPLQQIMSNKMYNQSL